MPSSSQEDTGHGSQGHQGQVQGQVHGCPYVPAALSVPQDEPTVSLEPHLIDKQDNNGLPTRFSIGATALITIVSALTGAVSTGAVMRSDLGAAKEAVKVAADQQRQLERSLGDVKERLVRIETTLDDMRQESRESRYRNNGSGGGGGVSGGANIRQR